MKQFCEMHGRFEESEIKKYWIEKGLQYGYLKMCSAAKHEKETNGWKCEEV